jgi:hypothetical protein
MATQARRTTRRSTRFLRATIKAHMVMVCYGLVLLSTVAAHAALTTNGLTVNGATMNGLHVNGITVNGLSTNGMPLNGIPLNGLPMNGMPFNGMPINGLYVNGTPYNGLPLQAPTHQPEPLPAGPQERLPWNGLSQRALGTSTP